MSPPQLSTNAPILNISHPCEVGVFPLLWNELDIAVFNRSNRGAGELFGVNIPLGREPGFNDNS